MVDPSMRNSKPANVLPAQQDTINPMASLATKLLSQRFSEIRSNTTLEFDVQFSDGSRLQGSEGDPVISLSFKNARGQWRCILFGHVGLLEAYFNGDLEIEGDLDKAVGIAFESGFAKSSVPAVKIRNWWHEFRFGNRTIEMAKKNARFHYGLGADFYEKWLDMPLMMYTCAYWKPGTETVEQAQQNKIDHVCRKVRLQPGENVLDIGCGFGGFMYRAHQEFGVSVHGINTTTEQVDWLRDKIERDDMGHALSVQEADFREDVGQFDKVVSIGVLEHAGRDQQDEVVAAHARALKPGGLGMLHFIGHVGERNTEFYIRRHIFPGGWIPGLARTLATMESCGLDILDVENLRRHYSYTLDAWTERFDARWEEINRIDPKRFDDRFRRVWRTYLVSCAEMFRSIHGETGLFQILYSKGNVTLDGFPMSRKYIYDDSSPGGSSPAGD